MTLRPLRPLRLLAVALLLGLGIHACSSPTEPLRATTMTLSASGLTLDAIGATSTVTASIADQKGKAMVGIVPIWSSSASTVATVSSTGMITAVGNGTAQITATVETITQMVNVTVQQVPVSPVAVAGNGQTAKVFTALPQALQVRVEDRLGNAISDATVTYNVVSGGGTLSAATATTTAAGLASVQWTLGKTAGTQQTVSATVAGNGSPALFTATGLPDDPTVMGTAPNVQASGQRVKFGTAVPIRPAVKVADQHGNGIAGQTVTFVVTAGDGSVSGEQAVSDANGIATVGSWTLGPSLGINAIEARYGTFPPVVFTVTAIEDPCSLAGAYPLEVGDSVAATLSDFDCAWTPPDGAGSNNDRYDYYRFTLSQRRGVIIEMRSPDPESVDPYLYLYDAVSGATLAAEDDIELGVVQDARITRVLDAGTYLVRATAWQVGDRGPYSITLSGCAAGVPETIRVVAGNGQVAAPGSAVPIRPQVAVIDNCSAPVPEVAVTFATVAGIGSVDGAVATTDSSGVATVGGWTLAAGPNVLSATVVGLGPVAVFSASGKASSDGFDIALRFVTVPTPSQLTTFAQAARRWEELITGDLVNANLEFAGNGNCPERVSEVVDDVLIVVRLEEIDGVGRILGQAGPCTIRSAASSGLTVHGRMAFDTADLASLEAAGNFANVILHEMGHVLGIGTLWTTKGLLINASSSTNKVDTHFSGAAAINAFNANGGSAYVAGAKVPVENCQTGVPSSCGAGTINSHWRESVLKQELMTGYLSAGSNPLSAITVASLRDIGYAVDETKADGYTVSASLTAGAGLQSSDVGVHLLADVLGGPIVTVGADGRPVGSTLPTPVKKRRGR